MQAKKKIAMVGSIPPPYHGSNTYFLGLLKSEIAHRYDVIHVDISDHRGLENLSRLDFTNVKIALGGLTKLRSVCKTFSPDIVYIPVASNFLPFLRDGLLIKTASRYSDAKIVIHLHEGSYFRDTFYNNASLPLRKFIESALNDVAAAVVYSKSLERVFEGLVENTVSFFNGVDDIICKTDQSGRKDYLTVSYIGNLYRSKGVLNFLKAASLIHREMPDVRFTVCGAWASDRAEVENEIRQITANGNLKDRLVLTGTVPAEELGRIYAGSDLIIFPTTYPYEGCPLVIIEAMKHGKPVISSRSAGAIPEMIDDGIDGFLIDPENHREIAESAIRLLKDRSLLNAMGASARKKFENEFTKQKNIGNLIRVFESVLQN